MAFSSYKKYTQNARRGVKGEAFFESLIVDYAIPHRVARANDLGVDFLCEWIYGDRPTGILFLAQVKTSTTKRIRITSDGHSELNGLGKFTLTKIPKVDERTISYWKGLGLPSFLFVIVDSPSRRDCYYKRYTPVLDGYPGDDDRNSSKAFHQVNDASTFLAFADRKNETGGFARDLIVDYARLAYSKGHIVQLKPSELGFWPFPDKKDIDAVRWFKDPLRWHNKKIQDTCLWTAELLQKASDK